ncbi:MAG: molybdopterin-dependent oxidoreductase, partial [Actinobacteria bacterium]|nr:molybdopterin-dependent oxidoreductase [Actinomycetota bacterium]
MNDKKKNIIIIIPVVVALLLIAGIMAFLNSGSSWMQKESGEDQQIIIRLRGKEVAVAGLEDIRKAGEIEFTTKLDTSETDPEQHYYTGVPLISVLTSLGIDAGSASTVTVKAIDGYTVAFDISEVLDEDNIYIAYRVDGKQMGSKGEGGSGPYQVIVRKDTYSQRWCKFVMEID